MPRKLQYDPDTTYKDCLHCGTRFWRYRMRTRITREQWERKKYCSRACGGYKTQRGAKHPNWAGGRRTHKGYVLVYLERDHPFHDMVSERNYVREHRLVMAQQLGRSLLPYEQVHHRDGNRGNNTLGNLELRVGAHGPGATAPHCPSCTCFD